ncbi:MAG: hypothetical protein ACF8SC_13010 [Phycisphaerales bacterium JB037]
MTTRMNTLRAAAALLGLVAAAATAQPRPPARPGIVAIDDQLTEHRLETFQFVRAAGGYTLTLDPLATDRSADPRWIAAFGPTDPDAPPPLLRGGESSAVFVVELTDGQRLPALILPSATDDTLTLDLIALGEVELPLEAVRRVRSIDEPATRDDAGLDDLVRLRNGDRLTGFVATLGPSIIIETDLGERTLPLESVAEIVLANEPATSTAPLLWLDSGVIIAARSLTQPNPTSFEITPAEPIGARAGTWRLSRADLQGVLLAPDRWIALAATEPTARRAMDDRRWLPPLIAGNPASAVLATPDLEIPGPMEVQWSLPPDAERFSTRITLPESARVWGDFEFVVLTRDARGGERELHRVRLHAGEPTAVVAADLRPPTGNPAPTTLLLRIEAGQRGPIDDRAVLTRPIVLRGAPDEPQP